jgi:hypothetical protein
MNSPSSYRLITSILVLGALIAPSTGWTNDKDRNIGQGKDAEIYLPVPQPEIDLKTDQVQINAKKNIGFEVNASSWTPTSFNTPTDLASVSNYQSTSLPQISINMWNGDNAWTFNWLDVTPKFGVSYDQLQRTGSFGNSGTTLGVSQNVNLYSARAGVELTSSRGDFFGHLRPFVDLSLLPTWALATTSEVSYAEYSQGFLNFEEVAGLSWGIPRLANMLGAEGLSFEIGIEGTQGIGGSPLAGFGILAGTRIEL